MSHEDLQNRVSIGDKVAFLCSPESYPERPPRVEVIETHMSWVFLTPNLVYKLKKPVRYDFLDFSTLAARHRNCKREVELNRRLAATVYRGILPLTMARDGRLELGGKGRIVDWMVVMRRLPAARMLDNALAAGCVTYADLRRLTRLLGHFYRAAKPVRIPVQTHLRQFSHDIATNRAELIRPAYGLSRRLIEYLTARQRDFLASRRDALAQRARCVVDAHGDLRPEHVCLTPRPVIIDCLEFRRDFRLLDPADELAYFAMECARLGNAALGDAVLHQVLKSLHEVPDEKLIAFYKTFRATIRAKIAIWHLADRHINHAAHWRRRATAYLGMARRFAAEMA